MMNETIKQWYDTYGQSVKDLATDLWQNPDNLPIHSLGCVIGTHIGPGAYGIAFFEK